MQFVDDGGIVQYRSELDKKLMKEGTKLFQHKGKLSRSKKGCRRQAANLTHFQSPGGGEKHYKI